MLVHYNGYLYSGGFVYYHSDDTAQANILWQWQNGYRGGAVVGDDNWIIKYPLYIFTNNLPIQPVWKLFLNSLIVLYLTATLMLLAIYGLAKLLINNRQKQKLALLLAGLSLVVIGQETFGVIKMPNSRNIELGIFMLLTLALLAYEFKPKVFIKHKKLKLVGLLLVVGILCANDPMFIYLGLAPLFAVIILRYFFVDFNLIDTIKYTLFIFGGLLTTTIFKKLIIYLTPIIFLHHPGRPASLQTVFNNTPELINSIARILGVDILDVAQQPSKSAILIAGFLLPVVVFSVWAVYYRMFKDRFKSPTAITYVGVLWLWIPFVYTFSDLSGSPLYTTRYLIMLIALLPISIILLIKIINKHRQLVGLTLLILVTVLLIIISSLRAITKHGVPNVRENQVINVLKGQNLTKGYGAVWDSGIISYLSGQTINMVSVLCNDNYDLHVYDLFSNKDYVAKQQPESFYIYNPKDPYVSKCTPEALVPQLGEPNKIIPAGDGYSSIVIYSHDIYQILQNTP